MKRILRPVDQKSRLTDGAVAHPRMMPPLEGEGYTRRLPSFAAGKDAGIILNRSSRLQSPMEAITIPAGEWSRHKHSDVLQKQSVTALIAKKSPDDGAEAEGRQSGLPNP